MLNFKSCSLNLSVILLILFILQFCESKIENEQQSKITKSTTMYEELTEDKYAETRSLLSNMAQDFLSRSGTNSQVVSLNLTNLFILVILKALIYAAGTLGAGAWHGKGRNIEENLVFPQLSESELLLYMGYLTGEPGHYECLHQIACKHPELAKSYYNAANLMFHTITTFDKTAVTSESKYQTLLNTTKAAFEFGEHGGPCEMRYKCN